MMSLYKDFGIFKAKQNSQAKNYSSQGIAKERKRTAEDYSETLHDGNHENRTMNIFSSVSKEISSVST